MRKMLAVLALLALGGGAAAFTRPGPGHRTIKLGVTSSTHPLLAVRPTRESAYLLRVNPRTLRPVRGPRLMVAGHSFGSSFSPDGRLLALGDDGGGEVWLVDTRRLRLVGRISADDYGTVEATAWLGDHLLAVVDRCCYSSEAGVGEGLRLAVLDPTAQKAVSRRDLEGSLQGWARTNARLVLVLGPRDRVGPARLAVVDAEGRVQTLQLERILAGFEFRDGQMTARAATPGLAVDETGSRAFVVGAGAPVAEIDLRTLAVTYHDLSTPISLLGRARGWLEPAAEAKVAPEGPMRRLIWLGDSFLAVTGTDSHATVDGQGRAQLRESAAGLKVIDTRDWSIRTIDANASSLFVANGRLLATSSLWDSSVQKMTGTGLTAYAPDGAQAFHLFGSSPAWVQVVGSRAFVRIAERHERYAIVDVNRGSVLRRVAGELPELLSQH